MASIHLEQLQKIYPTGEVALRDLTLQVGDGELVVLVGPSGCGKSTALRLVAGLEEPTRGRVLLGARDVTHVPSEDRDLAMVFQSYALYPHKTVAENLAFGLRMRRMPRRSIESRVREVARSLDLEALLGRRPRQLSGGERQRVALGRAIVRQPAAFLLDEPLSNLDAKLRAEMRAEMVRLHQRLRATMLFVTHDQEEAMTLGDRIAVLSKVGVEQVGPPLELYERPANLFVAEFIGSPAINRVDCRLETTAGTSRLLGEGVCLSLPAGHPIPADGRSLVLAVRPEDLEFVEPSGADFRGRVEVVEHLGRATVLHVVVEGAASIRVVATDPAAGRVGELVGLRARRERLHLFDAERGRRVG
jgi:multiple sugar transport system ATP-binding protein